MSERIAFILPGSTENTKKEKYQKIAGYFKKVGIEPIMVDIDWKRKTMTDYVNQFACHGVVLPAGCAAAPTDCFVKGRRAKGLESQDLRFRFILPIL